MTMEHGWAFWWIIPMMMFFWWGPHRYRRDRYRDRSGRLELDEETRARLAAVDQLEARVSELENRLDFTERLLAERTGPTSSSV
jgi:hypothetical protein